MKCNEICEILYDYINGELDSETEKTVKEHIEVCDSCKKEYELLLGMSEAVNAAQYEAPSELHAMVMSAIKQEKRNEKRRRFIKTLATLSASAAAFVIVVNVILSGIGKFINKAPNDSASDSALSIVEKADNVFYKDSNGNTPDSNGKAIELSAETVSKFTGIWECTLDDGKKITIEIDQELSVVVCVENKNGVKNYYDGTLEIGENGKITLSQSDGNVNLRATVEMAISNGKLFVDILSGSTPWGEQA